MVWVKRKRFLLGLVVFVFMLAGSFVLFIGPWPCYTSGYENTAYFNKSIAAINQSAKASKSSDNPGKLKAGWSAVIITPPIGTPMAGYGARNKPFKFMGPGQVSQGVHDELQAKALALSDGEDTLVLLGADILLTPPNVIRLAFETISKETPLTRNQVYFSASHTHNSCGAWGPGIAATVTGGEYDPKIVAHLAEKYAKAVIEAYKNMEPAKMAHSTGLDAKEFIRNRAHEANLDSELSYIVIEKDSGKRCILTSFSAHPTIIDDDVLEFTAEYPGAFQRAVERATGATTIYLGGATGSSGPRTPDIPNGTKYDRVNAMGEGLAKLVTNDIKAKPLQWETSPDITSINAQIEIPPLQLRIPWKGWEKWRLSPFAGKIAGLNRELCVQGAKIGDVKFVGIPADFSSEISLMWKNDAQRKGIDLWVTSFSPGYCGYISPDKYYNEPKALAESEVSVMSWTGPHQEGFFTALKDKIMEDLGKPNKPGRQSHQAKK